MYINVYLDIRHILQKSVKINTLPMFAGNESLLPSLRILLSQTVLKAAIVLLTIIDQNKE